MDELQFLKTHIKERESMNNICTVSDEDGELFEANNEKCQPEKNIELNTDSSYNDDTYFNDLNPSISILSPKEFCKPIVKNALATLVKTKAGYQIIVQKWHLKL